MSNPLQLFREYTINKKEVIENEDEIIFGESSFPKNFKTDYEKKNPKQATEKEYYTIGCLVYFMQNMHLIHPEYVQRAKEANVPPVWRPDRKNIIYYITGLSNTMYGNNSTPAKKNSSQVSANQYKGGKGKKSRNKQHNKYNPY